MDTNGHATTFGYDLEARQTSRTLPLGMTERFTYDERGNRATRTDLRGRTTTFAHDVMDRLTTITPDASLGEPAVSFTYTLTGRRASMTDSSGTTSYTYDARDRRLTKATPAGTLAYTYGPGGNVSSIRSSNAGGVHVEYAWDPMAQLTTVTDRRATPAVATHAYSATGQMTSATLPTGVRATYGRDSLDRVTGLSWRAGAGSTLASYAYTLGASGHRLSMVEASGRRVDYRYDDAHRLVGEAVAGAGASGTGTIGYVLDPTGNRLERTSTLAALPAATYAYDANDRLTSDGWDANGNATTCTVPARTRRSRTTTKIAW